jgi:hypothetical protein
LGGRREVIGEGNTTQAGFIVGTQSHIQSGQKCIEPPQNTALSKLVVSRASIKMAQCGPVALDIMGNAPIRVWKQKRVNECLDISGTDIDCCPRNASEECRQIMK